MDAAGFCESSVSLYETTLRKRQEPDNFFFYAKQRRVKVVTVSFQTAQL
jgi:hypothetical protein